MKRTFWLVLFLAALLVLVAGCTGVPAPPPAPTPTAGVVEAQVVATPAPEGEVMMKAPESNPKRGGILRTAWSNNPTHFDVHQGGGCTGCAMLYDGLIMWNLADGYRTAIPALAVSWDASDDGTVYTFKLREGVRFHDGEPFTSADVVATFSRIINPPSNLSIGGIREELSMVDSVTALDDMTVVFNLKQPTPYFLEIIAGSNKIVYSKKTLEENNYDLRGVTVPPGTGPFKFVDFIPGEKVVFEANREYWNPELPYVDGIELLHVPAWVDRGTAVLTTQADFSFNVSQDTWAEGQSREGIGVSRAPCLNSHMVAINNTHAPLDDPRVRRAIHLAVDRQAVIDAFTPVWEPAYITRWLPRATSYATPIDEIMQMPGYRSDKSADIEEARRLLAEAGYPDGFEITFTAWTEAASSEIAVPAFAEQLRTSLNVTGNINVIERPLTSEVLTTGNFDLFKADAYASPVLDPYPLWNQYLRTGASQNFSRYSNAEFDALLDEMAGTLDLDKRRELVNQGLDMLDENPPFFLIGFCAHSPMWNSWVHGLQLEDRLFSVWDRFETVWLDK